MIKNDTRTIGLILIFSASVFFQSCSPTKLSSYLLGAGSQQKNNTSSVLAGFIAPTSTLGSASQSATAVSSDKIIIAKEYKYSLADRYFITARAGDQQIVETGVLKNSFTATGAKFNFYHSQVVGSSPLCRFYVPATKAHFYTADTAECTQLKATTGYINEGAEGYVVRINQGATCPVNTSPVYRAFSNSSQASEKYSRFTTSLSAISTLTSLGWINQGIAFCSPDEATVPVVTTPPVVVTPPPVSTSCGVMPSGYAANICQGFYQNSNNASLISYCQCVNAPPAPTSPPVTPVANASCSFGSTTILHTGTVTAYAAASVTAPSTCQSEVRTCLNGVLSGSYTVSSCAVVPVVINPPSPGPVGWDTEIRKPVVCSDQAVDDMVYVDGTRPSEEFLYRYGRSPNMTLVGSYSLNEPLPPGVHGPYPWQTFSVQIMPGKSFDTVRGSTLIPPNMFTFGSKFGSPPQLLIRISPCRGDFTSANARSPHILARTDNLGIDRPATDLPPSYLWDTWGENRLNIYVDESGDAHRPIPYQNNGFDNVSVSITSDRIWYINIKKMNCPDDNCLMGWGFYGLSE